MAAGVALALLSACASSPPTTGGVRGEAARVAAPIVSLPPGVAPRRTSGGPLQCVPFARNTSGIQIFGDANTWWAQAAGRYPRSVSPAPGSVLVMRGYRTASRGHVAYVSEVVNERLLLVDHANWLNGGEVTVGVPVLDVSANNDWSEVRVWHVPGGHWGGRIYQADGFIHPFLMAELR